MNPDIKGTSLILQGIQRSMCPSDTYSFVIHKHLARALHYDLRLEINGVMPSWSVPKGPSLDPSLKRLAMESGDHDLEYRNYEGSETGQEGKKNVVMIWDEGHYWPEREIAKGTRIEVTDYEEAGKLAREDLESGILKFILYGKKLQGSFALVRAKSMGKGNWLLLKHRDEYCVEGYDAANFDFSARSGLSMDEI